MLDRDSLIKKFREETIGNTIEASSEEKFQNQVIRPILKQQGSIFIASFKNYIKKHKNVFYSLSPEKQLDYIENALQKDLKFRNILKGMIISWFTLDEFDLYIQNSSSLNKRMLDLLIEQLKSELFLITENQ